MADQAKLRKRLEAILKLPENQICADCGKRGPRWASANLGVFMCIECSGIHRNLGVHISFVRSVNLDSWQPKQVQFMEEWGNARANAYYEANIPRDYVKPKETDPVRVVERFIRDKYELKRFIAREVPPRMSSAVVEEEEAPRRTARPSARPSPSPVTSAPSPVPITAAAPKEENLIDFFDVPAPAAAPLVPATVPAAHTNGFDNFGAPAAPPSNGFGHYGADPFAAPPAQAFGAPPANASAQGFPPANAFPTQGFPPQQQHAPAPSNQGFPASDFDSFGGFSSAPAAPQAPKASADAILSLYNTPNNKHQGGGGMGGMSMMPPPQQLYGQPLPHQHAPHMGAPMHHPGHMMPQPGHHAPQPYGYPPVPPAGYGMHHQANVPMMQGYPPRGPPGHMQYPPQNGFR